MGGGEKLQQKRGNTIYNLVPIKMLDNASQSDLRGYVTCLFQYPILTIKFSIFQLQYLTSFVPPITVLGLVVCMLSLCASIRERCGLTSQYRCTAAPLLIMLIVASHNVRCVPQQCAKHALWRHWPSLDDHLRYSRSPIPC